MLAGIKAIGVKTTLITSAIFAVGLFNLKKKEKMKKWRVWSFSARKSSDVRTLALGGIVG